MSEITPGLQQEEQGRIKTPTLHNNIFLLGGPWLALKRSILDQLPNGVANPQIPSTSSSALSFIFFPSSY